MGRFAHALPLLLPDALALTVAQLRRPTRIDRMARIAMALKAAARRKSVLAGRMTPLCAGERGSELDHGGLIGLL